MQGLRMSKSEPIRYKITVLPTREGVDATFWCIAYQCLGNNSARLVGLTANQRRFSLHTFDPRCLIGSQGLRHPGWLRVYY